MGWWKWKKSAILAFLASAIMVCIPLGGIAVGSEIKNWSPKVSNVRVGKHPNKTRIVLDIDRPIKVNIDTSDDKKTVFIELPKVKWSAPAFKPNQSTGHVIEFKYASSSEGDRFNILTDKPVQVAKPFMVKPRGNKGHRLVIDLKPIKIDFASLKREQLRNEIRHKLLKKTSFKKQVIRKNHSNMLASTENLAMPSEDPPKIEISQNQNQARSKFNDAVGTETASNNSYEFYAKNSVNDHSRPSDVSHQLVYVKGMAGFSMLSEITNKGSNGNNNTMEFNPGYHLAGGLGIHLGSNFRAEVEGNYSSNEVDQLRGTANGVDFSSSTLANNDVSAFSVMGNLAYDFQPQGPFVPYVSGGLGIGFVSWNNVKVNNQKIADDKDWIYSTQLGGGLAFPLDDVMTLDFSYKYIETQEPELGDARGVPFVSNYSSHNFLFGTRLTY